MATSTPASPRVLVLGASAALRVRGGALIIDHGSTRRQRCLRFNVLTQKETRGPPFDAHGEFMTGEALRWCSRHRIALILSRSSSTALYRFWIVRLILPNGTSIDPDPVMAQCRSALTPAAGLRSSRGLSVKIERMADAPTVPPQHRPSTRGWLARLPLVEPSSKS